MVLGLERDSQNEDELLRNTTLIRVLKNRFSGDTGPASYLRYERDTGRQTEIDRSEIEQGDEENEEEHNPNDTTELFESVMQ